MSRSCSPVCRNTRRFLGAEPRTAAASRRPPRMLTKLPQWLTTLPKLSGRSQAALNAQMPPELSHDGAMRGLLGQPQAPASSPGSTPRSSRSRSAHKHLASRLAACDVKR